MRNLESELSLITLPKRGLRIIAPEHTRSVMELARKHKQSGTRFTAEEKENLWPGTEKARLWLMKKCATLARRYPTPEDGNKFMEDVDYQRREELLEKAKLLSKDIVSAWQKINQDTPIAVLLFGSIAKGLVKLGDHPDPSNIDIAVIGDITAEEREKLMDEIRPNRKNVQEWVLKRVPFINSSEKNPGNAGVFVQNRQKLTRDGFEPAKNYIASGAITLYDPEGIWQNLEHQALLDTLEKMNSRKNNKLPKKGLVFSG